MPLTRLELICYEGYAWSMICKPNFAKQVKRASLWQKHLVNFTRSIKTKNSGAGSPAAYTRL